MCDNCRAQMDHGVTALEALANGEEIPVKPEPATEVADFTLPFPVLSTITDNGFVGIITTRDGWEAIEGFLKSIGEPT